MREMVLDFVARQSLEYPSRDLRVDFLFLIIGFATYFFDRYNLEFRQCLSGVIRYDVRTG